MKKQPYGTVSPALHPAVADSVLDEFFQIIKQLKMVAVLEYGLCLGFVRDGKYIEGDNDLDVGVVCSDSKKRKLITRLEEQGFIRGRSFYQSNTHFYKNKILVDVHFRTSDYGFYTKLENVSYKGKEYPVPSPVGAYLTIRYSNWQIKA